MEIIGKEKKSQGVQVQVKDVVLKKSLSFTVHNMSHEEVFHKIYNYVESLQKYDNVRLVCYKKNREGDLIGEKDAESG